MKNRIWLFHTISVSIRVNLLRLSVECRYARKWFKIISNEEKETNEHIRTGRKPQRPYQDGIGNPMLLPVKSTTNRNLDLAGRAA